MRLSTFHYVTITSALVLLFLGVLTLQSGWDFLLIPEKKVPKLNTKSSIEFVDQKPFPDNYVLINAQDIQTTLADVLRAQAGWTLVHYWATWCPPCRKELVDMAEFIKTRKEFRVVQISADFRWKDEIDPFLGKLGLKRQNYDYIDPGGRGARHFGTTMFPETYLVNADQKAIIRFVGPQPWLDPKMIEFLKKHTNQLY